MSSTDLPTKRFTTISKFAGEAFATEGNVRTVFASASKDDVKRDDKVIILVGPAGMGKSTFIDCMCNYFYGADLDGKFRYKIADEVFDGTTPYKTIIRYVFNETSMPFRPIVIDTPGISGQTNVQADAEVSELLYSFLRMSERVVVNAVGLVMQYSETKVATEDEGKIRKVLAMFPKSMMANVVPIISHSDSSTIPDSIRTLLHNLGLGDNKCFSFNSKYLLDDDSVAEVKDYCLLR
ncbi:hypothetical protein AB6A40_008103 [Gnathostoma spinigerum]|uniref:G domain-containing protein n=1 Tax=Gnathostoma spinigerum TaxID=75299 RepID=A0ABD6EVV5_9BILA